MPGRHVATAVGAVSLFLISSVAWAGFVQGSFWCEFPDDPNQTDHAWAFNYDASTLTLGESIEMMGPDQVTMSGETAEDSVFHVTKTVENVSGVEWNGYELLISGTGVRFVGSAFSDVFQNQLVTDSKITFSAPEVVPSGEGNTVTLDFNVEVSTVGLFELTITQNPIPEPGTIALLVLGALVFVFTRKRS